MTVFALNTDQISWKEMDDQFIVIHLESTHYYSLNESGSVIWSYLIENDASSDQIISHLSSYYGVPAESVNKDVQNIITHLLNEELINQISNEGKGHEQ